MTRVVVAGSGMSGLAAAIELANSGADVLLIEAGSDVGGAVRTHRADGFLFEDGPTSALDTDGIVRSLCRDAGVEAAIVEARPESKARYLMHRGVLRNVPSGPGELLKTPLLTFVEKVRFLREASVKPAPDGTEESVSGFVARRFGRGLAAKFTGAIVSGIYAGDPERLSLDAAFPELRSIERAHGSILGGMKARAAKRRAEGGRPPAGLITLQGGLARLPAACREKLGDRVRLGSRIVAVDTAPGGLRLGVEVEGRRESLDCGALVLATPARAAAALPGALPQAARERLDGIEHASLAVVQAGFRRDDLPGLPPGFGFLVPRAEGLASLGWIFLSQLFDGRAPDGCVALSGFFGGMMGPAAFDLDDRALGDTAVRELARVLSLPAPPRPAFLRIVRWRDTLPQYALGHGRRVQEVFGILARENHRVVLAGNYLTGVSIPKCIERGRAAAREAWRIASGAVA